MGKKSKLKQERKEAKQQNQDQPLKSHLENTDFVRELQRQGYSLNQPQNSPEIPQTKIEPQI
jgi:hypothetical protein